MLLYDKFINFINSGRNFDLMLTNCVPQLCFSSSWTTNSVCISNFPEYRFLGANSDAKARGPTGGVAAKFLKQFWIRHPFSKACL